MPTVLEVWDAPYDRWVEFSRINPGDIGGSFSDRSHGRRELLHVQCEPDDSHTVVSLSEGGADTEMGDKRVAFTLGLTPIKEVFPGDEYQCEVLSDVSIYKRRIRVRHERRSNAAG